MPTPFMRQKRSWKSLILALIVVLGLSWLTSFIVTAHMPWYDTLQKPPYNPPSWAFGVVWPLLYVMMTVAAWLVWRHPSRDKKQVRRGRKLFILQLVLNLLWTPIFFGMENPQYGLIWLALVWLAVAATLLSFWRMRALAGLLMLPYLAWVSFAALLNYQIVVLN